MSLGEILSSIISGVAVLLLAWIASGLRGVRKDVRRFMAEHAWLLATTLWTRDKVMQIMRALDMPVDSEPPANLPPRGLSWDCLSACPWSGSPGKPPKDAPRISPLSPESRGAFSVQDDHGWRRVRLATDHAVNPVPVDALCPVVARRCVGHDREDSPWFRLQSSGSRPMIGRGERGKT